ncbi:hypothetical protein [Chryseobacterium sp. SL1]|uniref:hypothetical protein n=1 Tax=Chryseobacterium sp. SL1 TaxID=2995159 RepID=UPI002276C3C4|nr:hypothetical protein [Chryseobacterium sp. SL1]MCY1662632.1 hypothetical protein [Chryseobacterium sp. SL1]
MKNDLTHLVLINPAWFIGGLLIYFVLSLVKVHIIWDIQPKIFNNPKGENIFKGYFLQFCKALFGGTRLIRATFKYLFRYKEKDFFILKDEQAKLIKKRLNILDGLTTFLKPYLIFAFLWTLIEFWISRKLFYDESKIILGEIQTLLTFIERIPFVKFLQSNKGIIFLVYGIICVLIPFLYDREDSTKMIKKYFSHGLIYLSLLANISFFGVQTGKTIAAKSKELSDLQTKITSIHDSIFKELVVEIEFNDVRDSLKYDDNLYKKEISRFDSLIKTTKNLQISPSLKADLQAEFAKHYAAIQRISTVENSSPAINTPQPKGGLNTASVYVNNYYKKKFGSNSAYPDYGEYMGNRYLWNKETGEALLDNVRTIIKEDTKVTTTFDKKLEKILGCLFDYGFDASVTEIFNDFGIGTHKTLKKLVSTILSESYKKTVIEKVIKILNFINPITKNARETFAAKASPYQTTRVEEFTRFSTENSDYFFKEENSRIEANIKQKINSFEIILPENSEIISRLGVSTESEAIELLNELINRGYNNGYLFENGVDIKENIKRMERGAYFKVFTSNFYSTDFKQYNNSLKEYNKLLANQNSNLTLMKAVNIGKFIGSCQNSATICGLCGLPCAFPICLARR